MLLVVERKQLFFMRLLGGESTVVDFAFNAYYLRERLGEAIRQEMHFLLFNF